MIQVAAGAFSAMDAKTEMVPCKSLLMEPGDAKAALWISMVVTHCGCHKTIVSFRRQGVTNGACCAAHHDDVMNYTINRPLFRCRQALNILQCSHVHYISANTRATRTYCCSCSCSSISFFAAKPDCLFALPLLACKHHATQTLVPLSSWALIST